MYAGSRNLWLSPKSQDVWHRALLDNPWIEAWCREYPNYCLYGEITPTQKGFNYGVPMDGGQPKYIRFFLFDIRKPNGKWAEVKEYYELSQLLDKESLQDKFIDSWVPLLYDGPYNYNVIKTFIDGETVIYGSKHLREGVVIKTVPERNIPGLGRAQLKIVSNKYLEEEK
jgi:ATP-dependent RNA circularization protein (DNA/RNA ligase family)